MATYHTRQKEAILALLTDSRVRVARTLDALGLFHWTHYGLSTALSIGR